MAALQGQPLRTYHSKSQGVFRTGFQISQLGVSSPLYLCEMKSRSLWGKNDDVVLHAGADKSGPVIGGSQVKTKEIVVSLSDATGRNNIQTTLGRRHWYSLKYYDFVLTIGDGQQYEFEWERHSWSHWKLLLKDKMTNQVIARFHHSALKAYAEGEIEILQDLGGPHLDQFVILTCISVLKKIHKANQAAANSAGGGGGGA